MVAAEVGGAEVNLAVLAATLVDVVDFFPVVISLRREQVSLLRAGPGFLLFPVGVFRRGDDGDSAVLLAFLESGAARAADTSSEEYEVGSPSLSKSSWMGPVQRRLQPDVQQAAGFLRVLGAARAGAAGADGGVSGGVFWPAWPSTPSWAWRSSRGPMPASSPSTSKCPPARASK